MECKSEKDRNKQKTVVNKKWLKDLDLCRYPHKVSKANCFVYINEANGKTRMLAIENAPSLFSGQRRQSIIPMYAYSK